jgi:serine/threonine-protein kinase RsbW
MLYRVRKFSPARSARGARNVNGQSEAVAIMTDAPSLPAPAFHLRLPATAMASRTARRVARALAGNVGITGGHLDDVELAVSEACANAVVHGICDPAGTFEVTGWVCGDSIVVCTTDAGAGLGGSQAPGGLGLGLSLIARLSDDVQISVPADGGTQVRMTFSARNAAVRDH